jgi:putative ABC transport system ATP-binding protein
MNVYDGKRTNDQAFKMNIPNANQPIIQVKNVVKCFQVGNRDITVLKKISFEVNQGEFVSIVGPSGNGKSTLLNIITGIDRPTRGEIKVTGREVHRMNENELAVWRGDQVGIIFQFFQLLPALSLLKNVILPMDFAGKYTPRARRERALTLLEMVGLADQAHKLPSMVSRALANDPPLLVADEPTGNLDSHTAGNIFDLFSQLINQGKTMIMVTHDKELARRVPRCLEIVNGRIVWDAKGAS